ncbi:MAG: hypothetical protein FWF05_07345, partial [Oscillospiraceae bacterium]|nr:hypothetical protein [Oscillospiraceae bacterium]
MRTRKRVLSLFLSLVLVLLSAAPAFARAAAVSTPTPVIFLAGFGTELYLNDGTPEEKGVLMGALNTDDIFGALGEAVGTGLRDPLSALCSPSPTADVLSAFLMNWMGPLACDENGDSVYPVSNSSRNDRGQDGFYGNRPFYEFHFDWRLDPMEIAGELRDFIQMVKEETGSEKVNLYALSFGSVICCAYLEQYGAQDLESLFLCVSAHGGLVLAEDLIVKQLAVSGKGLAAFLAEMLRDETGQLSLVLSIMEYAGMFNVLEWLLNKALDAIRDRLYERAIVPLLAQMPAVWAFITD